MTKASLIWKGWSQFRGTLHVLVMQFSASSTTLEKYGVHNTHPSNFMKYFGSSQLVASVELCRHTF